MEADHVVLLVKRQKLTVFVTSDPKDSVAAVKTKLGAMIGKDADDMRLMLSSTVLDDGKSLADQKVANEAVLYVSFKTEDGSWEDEDVVKNVE